MTDLERPEMRSGFRYPDLERHVLDNRPQLVVAALTILRAHAAAGFPSHPSASPLGSFREWDRVIRHALMYAGLPDPVATQEEVHEDDDDQAKLLAVLRAWHRYRPDLKGTTTALVAAAVSGNRYSVTGAQADFWEALCELTGTPCDQPPDALKLGYRFRDARDKRVRGYRVVRVDKERGGVRWAVEYDGRGDDDGGGDETNTPSPGLLSSEPAPLLRLPAPDVSPEVCDAFERVIDVRSDRVMFRPSRE